tara:strand:- start:1203 stop:1328 length:126 start_codon:yes stop_codon:yes gene_type:complete
MIQMPKLGKVYLVMLEELARKAKKKPSLYLSDLLTDLYKRK